MKLLKCWTWAELEPMTVCRAIATLYEGDKYVEYKVGFYVKEYESDPLEHVGKDYENAVFADAFFIKGGAKAGETILVEWAT